MTRYLAFFVSLAAFALFGSANARAVQIPLAVDTPLPGTFSVSDSAGTGTAILDGGMTEFGDYALSGSLDSPTFHVTWTGTTAFMAPTSSRYITSRFFLTNLSEEIQDYVVELTIDISETVNGGLVSSSAIVPYLLGTNEPDMVVDAHRGGIPFLSLLVNDSVLLSTLPLDQPITNFLTYEPLLPTGTPEQTPVPALSYNSDIYSLGFRVAFSMTPGDTIEVRVGSSAAPIPEPSAFVLSLIGGVMVLFRHSSVLSA